MPESSALDALLLLVRATANANATLDKTLSRVGLWLGDLSLLRYLSPGPRDRAGLAADLKISQSETLRRSSLLIKLS